MNLSDLTDLAPSDLEDLQSADIELLDAPNDRDTAVQEKTMTDDSTSPEASLSDAPLSDAPLSDAALSDNVPTHPAHPGLPLVRRTILKHAVKKPVAKPVFKNKKKAKPVSEPVAETAAAISVKQEGDSVAKPVEETKVELAETEVAVQEPQERKKSGPAETFVDLDLPPAIQEAIEQAGYSKPSPIQAAIIPPMLAGRDIIAQSQTGSGKTAAFALPVLANLTVGKKKKGKRGPEVLVLAPTRELAMQVARSFQTYAGNLKGFAVTAIYGGQDYEPQKRALRDGVSVVVGTPGRVIDHIRKGTLSLDSMQCLVLDEADEMLNMGFLEDVEFVLEQCPEKRQIALFSATMPVPIRRIADRYLQDPHTVTIESKTMTADSINQRAIFCSPREKMDLLGRVLEAEDTDGVIIFAKTKESTTVIAEKLAKAGYAVAALNGDMAQMARQRTIGQLRNGKLNIVVATDVAARGLDVPRISHVINFDLPHDRESYVHRIGRTGRAGRGGEAILFLSQGSRNRLRSIEQMTKKSIEICEWPSVDDINKQRIERFKSRITETLAERDVAFFEKLIGKYIEESGKPIEKVAAALAEILRGPSPFLLTERDKSSRRERDNGRSRDGGGFDGRDSRRSGPGRASGPDREGMQRYRVEVGRVDGVRPGNLVGAIANEAGIDSQYIGPIHIEHNFTIIGLPEQMPAEALETLQRTRVMGKALRISRDNGPPPRGGRGGGYPSRGGGSSRPGGRGPKKGFGGKGRRPKR